MQFDNITGLYALLSLIPLIIIYLRKPRPTEQKIPSLMFIMKSSGVTRAHALFRKLISNLLFLIQLLALVLMSLAVAQPYMELPTKYVAKHTVIILDMSASMQAGDRFSDAQNIAKENLGGTNSIILVAQNPYIAGNSVSETRGKEIIDQARPTDTVTNLGSSILAAERLINESGGRVVVISDFIPTIGPNPNEAKRILTSKDIDVEFIQVFKPLKNTGIIDMTNGNEESKVFIKNFDDAKKKVNIQLKKEGSVVDEAELIIDAKSVETAEFETLPGESIIEIQGNDDFMVDNKAYISSPKKEQTDVMLITNKRNSNLEVALRSSPRIALNVQEPPKVRVSDSDVYIFSDINTNILLPGTPDDVHRKVKEGASVVIITQEDVGKVNWFGMMPIRIHNYLNQSAVNVEIYNKFSQYLQQGDAGKYDTENYFNATPENNSIVIASADDGSPLIAIEQFGAGKSVYYGVSEQTEFVLSPDYPVFWNNLVEFLVERGELSDYNKRFSDFYSINITKQGIYDIQGRDISINLLDEKESDINAAQYNESNVIKRDKEEFELEEGEHKVHYSFVNHIIIAVLILFAIELFIVKYRGEL